MDQLQNFPQELRDRLSEAQSMGYLPREVWDWLVEVQSTGRIPQEAQDWLTEQASAGYVVVYLDPHTKFRIARFRIIRACADEAYELCKTHGGNPERLAELLTRRVRTMMRRKTVTHDAMVAALALYVTVSCAIQSVKSFTMEVTAEKKKVEHIVIKQFGSVLAAGRYYDEEPEREITDDYTTHLLRPTPEGIMVHVR